MTTVLTDNQINHLYLQSNSSLNDSTEFYRIARLIEKAVLRAEYQARKDEEFNKTFLLDLGKHQSKKLAEHVKHGDDSFCLTVNEVFYDEFCPLPEGYVYDYQTAIRLKMRNVEPHTDFPINPIPENSEYVGSVFCPLNLDYSYIHLQVGKKNIKLGKDRWVMFDDRILHSVIAEKEWSGIAVQVFKKLTN